MKNHRFYERVQRFTSAIYDEINMFNPGGKDNKQKRHKLITKAATRVVIVGVITNR